MKKILDFPGVDTSEHCEGEHQEDDYVADITALWRRPASWLAIFLATVERIEAGLAKLRESFIVLHFIGYI